MLDAGLIDYRYTQPWADALLMQIENPPAWLCDVSMLKTRGEQIRAFGTFVFGETFEPEPPEIDKFQLACLWLRYELGEWNWTTYLKEAGAYLDSVNGDWPCEIPYHYLNLHEDAGYSKASEEETKQKYLEEQNLRPWIAQVRSLYDELQAHQLEG
jgi:hypothetical protein